MNEKILIIDDNSEFIISLYKYIQNEILDVKKIYIASNIVEGYENVKKFKPNIIIVGLNNKCINNIEILKKIKEFDTKIILIVNEPYFLNEVDFADFYNIVKIYITPFDFCKLKKDLKIIICQDNKNEVRNFIIEELSKFNFNKGSVGYKYLINCILEIYKYPEKLDNIEKDLFPDIAIQFNINNYKAIKWSIQKVIDSMIRYTDEKVILKCFPHTKKPTIKVFLSMMSDCLLVKYKKK